MARTSQSSSGRHFYWTKMVGNEDDEAPTFKSFSTDARKKQEIAKSRASVPTPKWKLPVPAVAVARLRSVLMALGKNKSNLPHNLGPRVIGTLFGHRRGHVHFAFQRDPASPPAFLVELATPISELVREMASGLVRIALECDKRKEEAEKKTALRLIEEPLWRTYCNGKKCGFASRREYGAKDWKVLKAVEPISMGTGVLPGDGAEGELMYMRARFERVVGSRDSEAFYMMNPDNNGAPELCVYLLRL